MNSFKQLFQRKWWLVLAYIFLLLAPVLIEQGNELLGMGECENIPLTVKLVHQRLCTAGYFKPKVHFTRIITLSKKSEPIQDRCEGREFMATLLLRLKDMGPALVVVDKWYSPDVCEGSPGTASLKGAITQLSETVPIILGENSDTLDELRANADPKLKDLVQNGFTEEDQLAGERPIVPENKKTIFYGLVRLNCDTRRIPLRWQAYPDEDSVRQKHRISLPSLSFAAATVVDKDIGDKLSVFLDHNEHPFTSFLTEDRFKPIHAMQIVCGNAPADPKNWKGCNAKTDNDFDVKNKVVVVGEYSSDDEHRSVLGKVPGFVLQANYVEALLGDRYFRSINRVLEIALTLASFLLINLIFESSSSPNIGLLWAAFLVFGLWMVSYLVVMQWGYVLTFWILSALAILAKYVDAWVARVKETKEKK